MYEPSPYQQRQGSNFHPERGIGAGWIIVLCILWTIFAPIPGPIDDLVVWSFGAYSAMRGIK